MLYEVVSTSRQDAKKQSLLAILPNFDAACRYADVHQAQRPTEACFIFLRTSPTCRVLVNHTL